MDKWLTLPGHGLALIAAGLIIPSALYAAPFVTRFERESGAAEFIQIGADVLLIHCCHSHPYPPYDRYCCHGRSSVRGAPVARTAANAAISYGAYRGVRSATKSAYKHGRNVAKKARRIR